MPVSNCNNDGRIVSIVIIPFLLYGCACADFFNSSTVTKTLALPKSKTHD
jgi:hypothetical protein